MNALNNSIISLRDKTISFQDNDRLIVLCSNIDKENNKIISAKKEKTINQKQVIKEIKKVSTVKKTVHKCLMMGRKENKINNVSERCRFLKSIVKLNHLQDDLKNKVSAIIDEYNDIKWYQISHRPKASFVQEKQLTRDECENLHNSIP